MQFTKASTFLSTINQALWNGALSAFSTMGTNVMWQQVHEYEFKSVLRSF